MAKSLALQSGNFEKFEQMVRFKQNENNLCIHDFSSQELRDYYNSITETGPDEDEINALIEDVWEDFEEIQMGKDVKRECDKQDEVNSKLYQFLKQNSEYVSGSVERYIRMVNDGRAISLEDRMGHLNLVAFERQEFIRKLSSLRTNFKKHNKFLKAQAVDKARSMMLQMYEEMKAMFKKEYSKLVDHFNSLVYEASRLDKKVLKIQKDNVELERLNSMKDRFYDVCPIKYITLIEDFELNGLTQFPEMVELEE